MGYRYSLEEIAAKLYIGYRGSKKGVPFTVISRVDSNYIVKLQFSNNPYSANISLKVCYINQLIDFDNDLFAPNADQANINRIFVGKAYEKSPKTVAELPKASNYTEIRLIPTKTDLRKRTISNYKELKEFIFSNSHRLPHEFFHITEMENGVSILNNGYICSRADANQMVVYDNIVENETTKQVMGTNKSERIERYVRFYLNPRNGATYNMKMNFKENGTFGVIFAIGFEEIEKAKFSFLTSKNAHDENDDFFDWGGVNNLSKERNLRSIDFDRYNYLETFREYDPNNHNSYLWAEALFYGKVSINALTHIYFASESNRSEFLDQLNPQVRFQIESKCVVDLYLHWESNNALFNR